MIRAEYNFNLPVPPAQAFAYMCNPANDAEWQSSCVSAELRDIRPGLASRYAIVFSFLGRKMSFQAEITEYDPPSRYAFRVHEGPFHYDGQYLFEPRGRGTHVHWRFDADPKGFFGIVPATLLRKVLVTQVEKDVVTLSGILLRQAEPALAS
jgi:carbon monoxide dehydrogenase subunit G